ncbi:MAG: nuclear transport factor 2 family protein [Niabella sp.]
MNTTSGFDSELQEIRERVRKINAAWYSKKFDELSSYFHEQVVFNSPDFLQQVRGKESCVQTYKDFMNASTVLLYNENDIQIQLSHHTAVVTYHFEMKYEQNNQLFHETGTDILVFTKDGEWKVLWRAVSNLKNN